MKRMLVIGFAAFLLFAGSAEAKYLPQWRAEAAIHSDSSAAAREVSWSTVPEYGECGYITEGRYECQVQLEGKRPSGYSYEHGIEYERHFCSWVAAAHWRGRFIVVNRREIGCEEWLEFSR